MAWIVEYNIVMSLYSFFNSFIYSPSIFSILHAHRYAITASECLYHAAEVKAFRAACSGYSVSDVKSLV